MTDYRDLYELLKDKPDSERVSILAVALKNSTSDVVAAIKNAIEEIEDIDAMERGLCSMTRANPIRFGVPEVIISETIQEEDNENR